MAEQNTRDVVKEAQSTGDVSPVDVNATSTSTTAANGTAPSGRPTLENKPSDIQPSDKNETRELVNGDAADNSASESHQAVGEISGGSDTDISRPGSVDQAQRAAGHLRTNSTKKPTSFKSVSVTKNFLAKTVASAPAVRPGEKAPPSGPAATSTLPTAKPRLVAKSGGANVPRSIGNMNGAGSGPDASKVWNKNQPIPPPPPKQFTDEELKQQYGIHLATRLQADESGKEAKWADIEDDEDDWTPETVQWMDGTKSTITAVENEPPPPEEPKTILKPAVVAKPITPSPPAPSQKTTLNTSTKAILKPGAHILASASKPKGQAEKATLVAKPSAAAPVKSPWAPLPPVEKASPVQINPPVQAPPSRYRRDSQGYDSMPPPSAPAKEIAPDDFNRSWRDERGNRELFNSHNGRYEPVRDTRRGSFRENGNNNNFRQQPSVLQRPSHDGPAEPSAAFQTSRNSADGPAWGNRRRNSSNVSGDSGRQLMFDHRGPDYPPMNLPRRESQSINGVDAGAPGMPRHGLPPRQLSSDQQPPAHISKPSPSMSQVQPASPFGSITSHDAATPASVPPMPNLVEVQQRVMHDNIDTIKQRKQKEREREAKEEEERKERLRKKMEALGLNTEPKKPKEVSPSPLKEKAVPATIQSPPKPPVPTAEGEVAQYGMMKVHQPQPVKKSPSAAPARPAQVKVPGDADPKPAAAPSLAPASTKLTADQTQQQTQQQTPAPNGPQAKTQAPAWSSTLPQQQPRPWASNVWGPPQAKDRALGNGTFVQQLDAPTQPAPTPIGVRPTSSHQQPAPTPPFAEQVMYPKGGPVRGQHAAASKPKPKPIAPPIAAGWGDFQTRIRRDDQDRADQSRQKLERLGGVAFRAEMDEVYVDPKGSKYAAQHDGFVTAQGLAEFKAKEEATIANASVPQVAPAHGVAQGARSSRFFPRPAEATQQNSSTNAGDSPPPPETQSHPVYTGETEHPVVRMPKPAPRVRLPPAIAEATPQTEAPVSMPPRSRFGAGIGSRPLALTAEWQARFNNLLEKPNPTTAPIPATIPLAPAAEQKPGALAIAASSKAPLDNRPGSLSATVSLPSSANKKSFIADDSSDVMTRSSSDMLLEDREFGSLPTIKLSKVPHLAANEPAVPFPSAPRQNSRYPDWPALEMFSKPSYNGEFEKKSDTIDVRVKLGNMKEATVKSMPKKRRNGRPGQPKPRRSNYQTGSNGGSPTAGQPGQPRGPRKPSNFPSQGNTNGSGSSPRSSTSNAWSNNRSTPANTSQPWGRRPAPTAPVH